MSTPAGFKEGAPAIIVFASGRHDGTVTKVARKWATVTGNSYGEWVIDRVTGECPQGSSYRAYSPEALAARDQRMKLRDHLRELTSPGWITDLSDEQLRTVIALIEGTGHHDEAAPQSATVPVPFPLNSSLTAAFDGTSIDEVLSDVTALSHSGTWPATGLPGWACKVAEALDVTSATATMSATITAQQWLINQLVAERSAVGEKP